MLLMLTLRHCMIKHMSLCEASTEAHGCYKVAGLWIHYINPLVFRECQRD